MKDTRVKYGVREFIVSIFNSRIIIETPNDRSNYSINLSTVTSHFRIMIYTNCLFKPIQYPKILPAVNSFLA